MTANKELDITSVIKKQIKNFHKKIEESEIGEVISVSDYVAIVYGLKDVQFGEVLIFEKSNVSGMAYSLEEEFIGVLILGDETKIFEGEIVHRTKEIISTKIGDALVGRVLNALGEPIDGKTPLAKLKSKEIFTEAPSIMSRQEVNQPLDTGILLIDSMIPIGKGQRELIIGDRQTGKTSIALDTIINQKGKDVICVYVAIGQKNSTVSQIVDKLEKHEAMAYTTVVSAGASESAPMQYIAPYTGVTIAEEWMKRGKNVLVVYDDLSKHAVAYRALSLLLRRPPGREAYPGDIFFQHSYLLERAAKLSDTLGGGSITALPIIETQAGDISAYIPTNVISITDGQIFTKESLFNIGQRPAVDIGFSVSRVGSAAQTKPMKKVVSSLKLELAQYNEMEAFAQFGSDLDESTKRILNHGAKVYELLKQPQYNPLSNENQTLILLAVKERIINIVPKEKISDFKEEFIKFANSNADILKLKRQLANDKNFTDETYKIALELTLNFTKGYVQTIPDYDASKYEPVPYERN
ncbi:F0F1 ATP synthase subunit alpha [Mycoplasma iguanae]|uniref:ATP synthase subunit alpha n=1 Tax=Mycoplasma iguanae TaxID=292461 RepID=A0ABY5R956_9MOLU|nr:F0F1 ATP synthase subunit alpha [Mycoplasma iguanae]UVD81851.1 F0F1 ATP synthase subunit alpha [Mycoplasma iguanae]